MQNTAPKQDLDRLDVLVDELISALASYQGWEPLRNALVRGDAFVDWTGHAADFNIKKIFFEEGHGCQDFGKGDTNTNYDDYLTQVIQPLITKGEISDGSIPGRHDDRKLRWSNTSCLDIRDPDIQSLRLAVGPTWYQRCQADIKREPIEAIRLMIEGLQRHEDPYAFFARGMGITAIPLTRDGHAFIGNRSQCSEYSNYLCFVAGWLSFPANLNDLDICLEVERELEEEIHLTHPLDIERIQLIGLAGQPLSGETDLVFVVQTDLTDDHFSQDIWPEHQEWFPILNSSDAKNILHYGRIEGMNQPFKIMFSSCMGLQFLIHNHWVE